MASAPVTASTAKAEAKAAKAANRALRKVVMRQLSRTRGLDVDGINVTAVDGVVTLLGTAPDTRQIDLAADVARDVAGVRAVHNNLTLQTNGK
ncbi:BON domain-containing protein [Paraburkholderia tagetis]